MTFWTNKKRFRCNEDIVDPTVNDDSSTGYGNFDQWINTVSCEVFILVDNTTGAAKWVSIADATATSTGEAVLTSGSLDGGGPPEKLVWTASAVNTFVPPLAAGPTSTVAIPAGTYIVTLSFDAISTPGPFEVCVDVTVGGVALALIDAEGPGTGAVDKQSGSTTFGFVAGAATTIETFWAVFLGTPIPNAPVAPLSSNFLRIKKIA